MSYRNDCKVPFSNDTEDAFGLNQLNGVSSGLGHDDLILLVL